jgi:hypothetical protein
MDGHLRSVFAVSVAQASDGSPRGPEALAGTVAIYQGGALLEQSAQPAGSGEIEIGVLVKTSGDAAEIAATGATIGTQTGEIVTARATLDELWQVAAIDSVSVLEASVITRPSGIDIPPSELETKREPALELGGVEISSVNYHVAGQTGEGVVLGVIDDGIDYTHPAFMNQDGSSVLYMGWDQTDFSGNPPSCCNFGTEWDQSDFTDMLNQPTCPPACGTPFTDQFGHGTAVAGAAFGQPSLGVGGISPGVTPAVVKTNFSTSSILDGANWLDEVAATLGDPLVINMSLGTHFGAHDGSTLFEQGLTTLIGENVAVIGAVGNHGNANIHTSFDVMTGFAVESRVNIPASGLPPVASFVFYGDGPTCVDVTTPNNFMTPDPVCSGFDLFDTDDACMDIGVFQDAPSGKIGTFIDFVNQPSCPHPIAGGDYTLTFSRAGTGPPVGVHGWSASGIPFVGGDNLSSVQIPATSPDVFAAGGFITRNEYQGADGLSHVLDPFSDIGDRYSESSRGPNGAGVIKPDISAPGAIIKAPLSRDANTPDGMQFPGGLYQAISGTSMSAPMTAGAFALVRGAYQDTPFNDIRSALINNALTDQFTGVAPNNDWGYGKLDLGSIPPSDNFSSAFPVNSVPFSGTWDLSLATTEMGEPTGDCTDVVNNTVWFDLSELPFGDYVLSDVRFDTEGFTQLYSGSEFGSLDAYKCSSTYTPTELPMFRSYTGFGKGPNLSDVFVQAGTQTPVAAPQTAGGGPAGPIVMLTISAAQEVPWGDLDCDGDADTVDALKALQSVAGLPVNQQGCPEFEGAAFAVDEDDNGVEVLWGDLDCDGDSDSVDALKALQNVAGLPAPVPADCHDLGTPVLVPG